VLNKLRAACLDVVDDAGHQQLAGQLRIGGENGYVAADCLAWIGDVVAHWDEPHEP
jgi:hypothetical protein